MPMALLAADEPPPFTAHNLAGASPCLLLCEHASNRLPRRLGDLGLPPAELRRHIAWDIGALSLAEALSRRLDAALFATGYSRLVIDCNRPLSVPSSIPERSEDTVIPGNLGLDPAARAMREATLFHPFQAAVAGHIEARRPGCIIGVHSFTPVYRGVARPWQAGVLFGAAEGFGRALLGALAAPGLCLGENEPYRIEIEEDYTVPVHGDARGLPALLIEVRQDLLADAAGIAHWAGRLEPAIRQAIAACDGPAG
ncbi:N-formylglutamate amidohydrolase [Belnapia moabensis]|uniref:N-formylglutamate amidohydrolase n=1 Tax=Belnapia moabensis TaxID=365533 RepID=UPI000AA1FCCE|nr:N-formylglutamate amidohydrolase [Belnapia moabensis]